MASDYPGYPATPFCRSECVLPQSVVVALIVQPHTFSL